MLRTIIWLVCVYLALTIFSGCAETNSPVETNNARHRGTQELQTGNVTVHACTHYAAGFLHERQGRADAAIEQYTAAIEKDPNFVKAYNRLSIVYERRGQTSQAESWLKKALTIAPNEACLHNNLALHYIRRGEYNQAEAELRKARTLDPNAAQATMNLGIVLAKQGQFDQALKCFQQVCRPHQASYNIAMLYRAEGNRQAARRYYERSLELDPGFVPARKALETLENLAGPAAVKIPDTTAAR